MESRSGIQHEARDTKAVFGISSEAQGQTTTLLKARLQILADELSWDYRGSADSKESGGYDHGNTVDSLWQGGGATKVPEGLKRSAGGG